MAKDTVLVIPDIHAPFQAKGIIAFLSKVYIAHSCTRVVCLGDEIDFHAISNWDKDPDGLGAGAELEAALGFMHNLYKTFPDVEVCTSNHTARPFRKAFGAGMPKKLIKGYSEFLEAPNGWSWHDRIVIDGVQYIHGEGFSGKFAALNAAERHRQSTVIGHVHSFAGVTYSATNNNMIFGMNAGCLIDINAYAFKYGKHFPMKPTLGCGVVKEGRDAIWIPKR